MRRAALALLLLAAAAAGQVAENEERDLGRAIGEAGSSPIELIRAIEKHLERYPESGHRAELEEALVKAAIEAGDEKRIIEYGERVLAREPGDIQVLDRVTRALLSSEAKETSARALKYARLYGERVSAMGDREPPARLGRGEWSDALDRGRGRALVLEARALGNLGRIEEAIAAAARGFEAFPSAEAAREESRWLERAGRRAEAIERLAEAFMIPDERATDAVRRRDRARLSELYRQFHDSEAGLGDLILAAYDRTTAVLAARRLRLRESDPNLHLTDPMEFTLSGLGGGTLSLAALKGKTVVFDFWATWCGPCRAQHPLYEEVKERFRDNPEVVFLSINTDEDREAVEPFLEANGWRVEVWFEDGLSRALKISSIPTTIVIDRRGKVVSRMNGFVPSRFVDMLSERIREALGEPD